MSFPQFLSVLRARFWAALLVFVLVVATAVGVSLVLPRQYLGEASVVIDVKPDPVALMATPGIALPSFMATQVDILASDRVALRVIKDLKLAENPQIRQQWQDDAQGVGSVEQWLIALLHKQLDVRPSRESNVIAIAYKSPDPRFAAALANAFAQAYIATTLELRVDPAQNFRKFFDVQTQGARDALEKAQSRLSAYQRQHGIIASDERLDIENARLNELSSQLTQLQAISAESSSRQAQAQGAQGDRLQEVLANPVVGGLKAEIARSEARLKELGSRYGDRHPQVLEARASLAELRERLAAETQRVTSGVGVTNTINRQREGQVRRELDAQRSKLLQMKAVRDEGSVLQREVENAQRVFDSLAARLNQTALEAQTSQSYASVLTTALPPTEPSSPKVLLNMALAVFLGVLLAIGVALLLELADRRVRSPEDAVAALGLPVIGTLPKPGAKRFLPGNRALLPGARGIALPAPLQEG